jgi:hypothetical protein
VRKIELTERYAEHVGLHAQLGWAAECFSHYFKLKKKERETERREKSISHCS